MTLETRPQRPPDSMGRSVRIVGPQESPDPHNDPHAMNRRGELGPLSQNYYNNKFTRDPMGRVGSHNPNNDGQNVLGAVLGRTRKGAINERRVAVPDPAAMARHIKRVAVTMGASAVGIASTMPEYIYSGGARRTEDESLVIGKTGESPEDVAARYPYAICLLYAWDPELVQAHRHPVGDNNYHFSGLAADLLQNNLAGYVRDLGYEARQGAANPMPMMVAAGLGELGRLGLVISKEHGARVHPRVFLTDLPLAVDRPVDLGVPEFCGICRKCAIACPTNSISHDEKKVVNGVEKWAINWKTCYTIRPHMASFWNSCFTCVATCPYTKPRNWWRRLGFGAVRTLPYGLRPLAVRPMVWLDDRTEGRFPLKRVRWLGYDTGRTPGEGGCTIKDCSCHQGEEVHETGQYPPFKDNTTRFRRR